LYQQSMAENSKEINRRLQVINCLPRLSVRCFYWLSEQDIKCPTTISNVATVRSQFASS
jgi:hypothetical protein